MKKIVINIIKTSTNIREKMSKLKISKAELREALELKTNFKVNKILKGEALPSLKELVAMCNLFNTKTSELIDYCILEKLNV